MIAIYLEIDEFTLRHFYCIVNSEEFILTGDTTDIIYCTELSTKIGNILIELLDFSDTFKTLLINCKNNIQSKEYYEDKNLNKDLICEELFNMQKKLNDQCNYFKYTDILIDITQKYNDFCGQCYTKKQKHIDNINLLKELENIVPNIPSNTEALLHFKEETSKKEKLIAELEDINFKDFTLKQLDGYISELDLLITNVALYCKNSNDTIFIVNDVDKICGTTNFMAYNYNLVSDFQKFSSVIKGVVVKDGQIFTDEAILKEKVENIKFIQIYQFNNIIELLNLTFINLINQNVHINFCHNCENFFIPENRTDEKYCNRISPQNPNKTCKEYGAKKTYRDEIKSIPLKYEHNKTSQFYRMRINRSKSKKEKLIYKKAFDKYKKEYQNKKSKYKLGKLNENDFIEWIKYQKNNI